MEGRAGANTGFKFERRKTLNRFRDIKIALTA